jgi:hypothetical protein
MIDMRVWLNDQSNDEYEQVKCQSLLIDLLVYRSAIQIVNICPVQLERALCQAMLSWRPYL